MEWARLRGIDLQAKRTAPIALDERSNVFCRFETWETDGSGFSGRRRPGQSDVRDHSVAPIVKAWTRFRAFPWA